MNASTVAVRAGFQRGWIEFRQIMTNAGDLVGWLWPWVIAIVVMYVLRDKTVPGTSFSLGSQAIPGLLAWNILHTGLMGMSVGLTMERDDGTLLRMKATPNGMIGYLIGKVVSQATLTVAVMFIILVPAAFLFDGLRLGSVSSWLTLAWVLMLGLVAMLPFGAILGSLFRNAGSLSIITLLIMGLVAISGVFYPINGFPEWLQWLGQAFPLYWLALGMRSALLPEAMSTVEIGQSWRHLETIGVLGVWAVVGFVLAPIVLRRMARRESGSSVAPARQKTP